MQTPAMTTLQMVRAVLHALSQPRLFSRGVFSEPRGPEEQSLLRQLPSAGAFRKHHECVFVDASGHLNLAAHLSSSAAAQVRGRAKG
jgi:hypothetical protein